MERPPPPLFHRALGVLGAACFLTMPTVAHHPPPSALLSAPALCVDDRSIVLLDDASGAIWGPALAARLRQEAAVLLSVLDPETRVRSSCHGEDAYVRLDVSVRKLDPAVYLDADDATYGFRIDLRVARHDELATGRPPEPTFHAFSADLHAEAETGTPIRERLLSEGRHAFGALTEAHAAAPVPLRTALGRALLRPPILAPALGLLLACAASIVPLSLARSSRAPRVKGTPS